MEKIVNVKDRQIKVVPPEMARDNITLSDADMDNRARHAVRSALPKQRSAISLSQNTIPKPKRHI